MKNRGTLILLAVTLAFLAFTAGFFLGRNSAKHITVQPEPAATAPMETQATEPAPSEIDDGRVNINTAALPELSTLPGIGQVIGQRIIDYRTEHGPFTNVGQLANVEGIGEKRLEELLSLITVGG